MTGGRIIDYFYTLNEAFKDGATELSNNDWLKVVDSLTSISQQSAIEGQESSFYTRMLRDDPRKQYRATGAHYEERARLRAVQEYTESLASDSEALYSLATTRTTVSIANFHAHIKNTLKILNTSLVAQLNEVENQSNQDIAVLREKCAEINNQEGIDELRALLESTSYPEQIVLDFYKAVEKLPEIKNQLLGSDTVSDLRLSIVIEGLKQEIKRLEKKYPDVIPSQKIDRQMNLADNSPLAVANKRIATLQAEVTYLSEQKNRCSLAKKITYEKLDKRLDDLANNQKSTNQWSRFFKMEKYFKGSTGKEAIEIIKLEYKNKTPDEEIAETRRENPRSKR